MLRVIVTSIEVYARTISIIRENELIGYTFTQRNNKCYRIVIKDLRHSTPHAIIGAIEETDNKVRGEIINARYGSEKVRISTFYVNIEPSANN